MKVTILIAVFCLSIMLIGSAMAVVAGNTNPPDPSKPDFQGSVYNGQIDFDLGDVIWDPEGKPIIKQIDVDGPGDITLTEFIHVGGNVPWTDWDEQIMVPDGAGGWVPSPDTDLLEWINPTTVNVPANVTDIEAIDLLIIDFVPPLQPSTNLVITKTIANPNGIQSFQIWQWPTIPEPAIALIAFALLVLRFRRQ